MKQSACKMIAAHCAATASPEGRGAAIASGEGWGAAIASGEGQGVAIVSREGRGAVTAPDEGRGAVIAPGEGQGVVAVPGEGQGVVAVPGEGEGAVIAPGEECCVCAYDVQSLATQGCETEHEETVEESAEEEGFLLYSLEVEFGALPVVGKKTSSVAHWNQMQQ